MAPVLAASGSTDEAQSELVQAIAVFDRSKMTVQLERAKATLSMFFGLMTFLQQGVYRPFRRVSTWAAWSMAENSKDISTNCKAQEYSRNRKTNLRNTRRSTDLINSGNNIPKRLFPTPSTGKTTLDRLMDTPNGRSTSATYRNRSATNSFEKSPVCQAVAYGPEGGGRMSTGLTICTSRNLCITVSSTSACTCFVRIHR
jgi:hypothetical protein